MDLEEKVTILAKVHNTFVYSKSKGDYVEAPSILAHVEPLKGLPFGGLHESINEPSLDYLNTHENGYLAQIPPPKTLEPWQSETEEPRMLFSIMPYERGKSLPGRASRYQRKTNMRFISLPQEFISLSNYINKLEALLPVIRENNGDINETDYFKRQKRKYVVNLVNVKSMEQGLPVNKKVYSKQALTRFYELFPTTKALREELYEAVMYDEVRDVLKLLQEV